MWGPAQNEGCTTVPGRAHLRPGPPPFRFHLDGFMTFGPRSLKPPRRGWPPPPLPFLAQSAVCALRRLGSGRLLFESSLRLALRSCPPRALGPLVESLASFWRPPFFEASSAGSSFYAVWVVVARWGVPTVRQLCFCDRRRAPPANGMTPCAAPSFAFSLFFSAGAACLWAGRLRLSPPATATRPGTAFVALERHPRAGNTDASWRCRRADLWAAPPVCDTRTGPGPFLCALVSYAGLLWGVRL